MRQSLDRRQFLRQAGAGVLSGVLGPAVLTGVAEPVLAAAKPPAGVTGISSPNSKGDKAMAFQLPDLPYAFDALEPYIDERTMQIHHGKHHAAYVTNLNKALESHADWAGKTIEEICAGITKVPEAVRTAVRNNGGGHYNHSLFWTLMAPGGKGGGGEPTGDLADAIKKDLGGFAAFKEAFGKAGVGRFGSGWAWLCVGADKKLCICSTPNQDNPLMTGLVDCTGTPLLGLDVWEHAYYLKYQNRRPDYIEAWWSVVNWPAVAERFAKAKK